MEPSRSTEGKLRVVNLVAGFGVLGGAERLAREIVTRLDPERFDRTLCVSRWTEELQSRPGADEALDDLRRAGVRFVGLNRGLAADVRAWWPLISILRSEPVDVLHGHMFGSNLWAAILGSVARVPVVIAHEHTWSFEGQRARKFLDRNLIARRADAVLAVSREDRRRMIEIERIDPAKLIVVPNGIPEPAGSSGRDVRIELGIPAGAPVIGTVCTLRPQKALDVLIGASAIVAARRPDLRVLIAGEGEERAALERQIAAEGLTGKVILLGRRTDVPDLLEALDIGVCSSDFEGSPLSVLEYMAAALPVVSTRVGGVPDLIEDGVQGLLVEPRRPKALAAAIGELLDDPARASEMGERARERRQREFDIDVTVGEIASIYERLVSARRARDRDGSVSA